MSLLDKVGLQELWGKIKNLVSSTTYTKTAIDTALNGKKSTQGAVSDPAASGTAVEFISGISQNDQGVISPSKKTVRTMGGASVDAAGSTGLVPAPAKGKQAQFLRGDGKWETPTHQAIKQNGVTGATANRYATCSTAANTAAKTATIKAGTFILETGATVYVKFTNSNTVVLPTLNINGTGDISIMRYGTTHAGTVESTSWAAGAVVPFTYDGTYWIMQSGWDNNTTYSNEVLGQGYGTCTTEAATAAKVVALSSYALIKGGVVSVKFTNSVPASATMSINQKSAKAIFYKGAAITAGVIQAGDLATFIYDGTQYNLLSIDRWQDDLSHQSRQIDGVQAAAAYVEDGVTASQEIPAESYYYHNGTLYYTDSVIAQGITLPQGNLVLNGGFNDLQNKIITINKRYLTFVIPGNASKTMTFQSGGNIIATVTARNSFSGGYAHIFLEGYNELIGGRSSTTVLAKGSDFFSISTNAYAITFSNTESSNANVYIEFISFTYKSYSIA